MGRNRVHGQPGIGVGEVEGKVPVSTGGQATPREDEMKAGRHLQGGRRDHDIPLQVHVVHASVAREFPPSEQDRKGLDHALLRFGKGRGRTLHGGLRTPQAAQVERPTGCDEARYANVPAQCRPGDRDAGLEQGQGQGGPFVLQMQVADLYLAKPGRHRIHGSPGTGLPGEVLLRGPGLDVRRQGAGYENACEHDRQRHAVEKGLEVFQAFGESVETANRGPGVIEPCAAACRQAINDPLKAPP